MQQNADLTHKPATVAVFQTTDYERFRMITGNRILNMGKIKKIITDIELGTNLLKYNPILVVARDGILNIIDGQHRFVVAKKIKYPVHYILAEELSLYQIARMNSNTEKWAPKDFLACYVALKNPHYLILEELIKEYPKLIIGLGAVLLQTGSLTGSSTNQITQFHSGEFKVKFLDQAKLICKNVDSFDFHSKFSRNFMSAVQKVMQAGIYEINSLAEKVNAEPSALHSQTSYKKYLTNLEEIANKGKKIGLLFIKSTTMESFTQLDITLIEKEATCKSAKDIAFLMDRPVNDVLAYLRTFGQEKGIVSHQELLDGKKKLRGPRAPRSKKSKSKTIISGRKISPDAITRPNEGRLKASDSRSVFKNKVVDYTKLKLVRIDDKTLVYTKPGETEEQAKQRFLDNKSSRQLITPSERNGATHQRKKKS